MTNMLQTSVAMSDIFSIRILTVLLKSKDYELKTFDFEFKLTNNKRGLEIFEKQIHRLLLLHDFD